MNYISFEKHNNTYKLYNTDAINLLKQIEDSSVGFILLDPPYGISKESGFSKGGLERFNITTDFGYWDNEIDMLPIMNECFRVLKQHGSILCFYDIWKISQLKQTLEYVGFNQIRFVEWIKSNPVPINSKRNYLTNAREIALYGVKKEHTFKSEYDNGIYNHHICNDTDRFHSTQKPIKLISDIIRKHTNKNDLVLDCFSGSGTTLLSCYLNNRNFIGCELDEDIFNKSCKRIDSYFKNKKNLF